MAHSVPIDTREITITPVFKHITVEDVPASERAGAPVMKTMEVVEVRFAGTKLYSPVFPVNAFWKRDGHRVVTYAERWADQYRTFLEGRPAEAAGTPLEMLKAYGISDSQLSLCRAVKVYSIEALHHLEGSALKSLGMSANDLKEMARKFMDDRAKGADVNAEIAALRAEIAAMRAAAVPADERSLVDQIPDLEAAADEDARKKALKDEIEGIAGSRPKGNPSVDTLEKMLSDLKQDA